MAILVFAVLTFVAAIIVWFLYLKRQYPKLKFFEAVRTAIIERMPKKSPNGGDSDENKDEVPRTHDGIVKEIIKYVDMGTDNDAVIDIVASQTESKQDESQEDPSEIKSPKLWKRSAHELQAIVDNSAHATPQEREDLVESL